MFAKTALSAWKAESARGTIITMSKTLDRAIGNGIPTGVITEFCGPPGSGKTQICLQLCVNVQIPTSLDGLAGSAVFIDTNHGFSMERLKEIANACSQHCQLISQSLASGTTNSGTDGSGSVSSVLGNSSILDNILCTFVGNYIELLAAVENLKDVLANNPMIRLIVIDSFSFLFRYDIDTLDRVRILYQLLADLDALAVEHKCAVVITNELTTRLAGSNDPAQLVPALGDSHSHRVTQQIMLGRDIGAQQTAGRHLAHIRKSLYRPESIVAFRITRDGISDDI